MEFIIFLFKDLLSIANKGRCSLFRSSVIIFEQNHVYSLKKSEEIRNSL